MVRTIAGVATFGVVVGGAGWGVATWLGRMDVEPLVVRCAATSAGTDWYLEPDQAGTAALLAGTSLRRGLPARATTIAIATGLQESKLRNIDYGDRDSLGIFQQRPSQGWGTVEQVMDPVFATNAFFDALVRVEGYQDLPVTEAAQAVQRSGFPDAYAQHETRARAWASAMYGYEPGALTCTLPPADGPGDPAALAVRIDRDLGGLGVSFPAEGIVEVDASSMAAAPGDADRMAWAVAHWAVAVAHELRVDQVHVGTTIWQRTDGAWTAVPDGDPVPAGSVRITVSG